MMLRSLLCFLLLLSAPANASIYYINATGSDNNACTISSPCLTPNHLHINPGDEIIGQSAGGPWNISGYFALPAIAGSSPAVLTCDVPGQCSLTSSNRVAAMWLQNSHWQVTEWVISNPNSGPCIAIQPNDSNNIYDFFIFNNLFNQCKYGAVSVLPHYNGPGSYSSADAISITSNVVYNAAIGSTTDCAAFFSMYGLQNSGVTNFSFVTIRANFLYGTVATTQGCGNATSSTDRSGVLIDDGPLSATPYTGIVNIFENVFAGLGGSCFKAFRNSSAAVYVLGNTCWHDVADGNHGDSICSELRVNESNNIQFKSNLAVAGPGTCMGGAPIYALGVSGGGTGTVADTETGDQLYSPGGYFYDVVPGFGVGACFADPKVDNPTVPSGVLAWPSTQPSIIAVYQSIISGFGAGSLCNGAGAV